MHTYQHKKEFWLRKVTFSVGASPSIKSLLTNIFEIVCYLSQKITNKNKNRFPFEKNASSLN